MNLKEELVFVALHVHVAAFIPSLQEPAHLELSVETVFLLSIRNRCFFGENL